MNFILYYIYEMLFYISVIISTHIVRWEETKWEEKIFRNKVK